MTKEEIIGRIVCKLPRLTDAELEKVYSMVRTLQPNAPDVSAEKAASTKDLPFVDEVERVQEQSRRVPDRREDQYFS